jgi:hypothetical protein
VFTTNTTIPWTAAFGLVLGIWVFGAGVVEGAYAIKLKNGNEYVTSRYWQEGGQVLFDTYGGIFGIEKSFVARIEKADPSFHINSVMATDIDQRPPPQSAEEAKDIAKAKTEGEVKEERKRDPDDPIAGEFSRLKEQSKQVNSLLTSEIRELLNQITAFKNKIAKDSKLFIDYGREFNELNEIGSAVETALQSRTQ